MFQFVIIASLLNAAAVAEDVASKCFMNDGKLPISFEIEGCFSTPCVLPQMEDAIFNVKFNAAHDSRMLRVNLVVYIYDIIGIPYDLGADGQACYGLVNATCPVNEGQELDYTLKLPIHEFFPVGESMSIEIGVLDDAVNSAAFCARVPVVIAPAKLN